MSLEYITTRDLRNKAGEERGKVRIVKMMEESDAAVELACPECGNSEKRREAWKEPFVTGEKKNKVFTLACGGCGFKVKLINLEKQAKKEAKSRK